MNFLKKIIIILILTILFGIFPKNTYAISAQSAVVIDGASGRVLYEHNSNKKRGMASTTKIMTALCALEYGDMNKMVTISPTASGIEGSSMYLAKGEKITMRDLVYGLMLVSGNDAATAIAENVAGSVENFAELMNKKAAEIGAYNTSFTNPHGLSDENHYTTALDLAKITAYAMQNPIFCDIVSTKTKTLPANEGGYARTLINHNKFLSMYEGCIGVKTGFTKATGRCLVSAAEKNDLRLICVTLGAPDDWNDHRTLLDSAFSNYSAYKINSAGDFITAADIKSGIVPEVELVACKDIIIPIKQGEESLIKTAIEPFEDLSAPIEKNDILGVLKVKIGNEPSGEFPLIAKESVELKKVIFKSSALSLSSALKKSFYLWLTCFN